MSCIFTDYVRGVSGDSRQDWSRYDSVLKSLRSAVIQELKRKDLWNASPGYLGVFGGNRWEEGDLLDELILDCFEYIFVRRIQGLRNQARVHANIDGLIILNVQHFLHDAQRRHDPLGYRVFEIVRDAVETLLRDATLHLLAGDPSLRNDTLLSFSELRDESPRHCPDPSLIRGWNDSLMPDLVTAWRREGVIGDLAAHIASLSQEGCTTFLFRDLINPLKEDARARWLAMVCEGVELTLEASDEQPFWTPVSEPRQALEEKQDYFRLLTCIARGIEQSSVDERTKDYLRRLLDFLRQWTAALEEGPSTGPPPADVRISELLQIPRGRIQELKENLGSLANACRRQETILGVPKSEARLMKLSERREWLGRLSLEALTAELERSADGSLPVVGDTLIFSDAEPGIEWLLLAFDASGRALLIPLDAMPLAGVHDLALDEQIGEPLTARCNFSLWLTADFLVAGTKARHVEEEVVKQVHTKLEEVEGSSLTPTLFEREAEADSEYRRWAERLRVSRLRLQTRRSQPVQEGPAASPASRETTGRRGRRRFSPGYALAAALLVAVLGLSWEVHSLRQRLRESAVPILIPSRAAGELRLGSEERGLETRLVTAGEDHALLYLVFRDVPRYPSYAVRLLRPGDSVWWQSRAFSRGEQLLILPVQAEPLRFQLLGLGVGGTVSILDDRRLVPEAPPTAATP